MGVMPAIPFSYDNEAAIPAALRTYYKEAETGSGFVLDLQNNPLATKLSEFRENNTKLMQERDTLKKQFEGVDPEEFKKLKTRAELLEEGKLIKAEGLDAAVNKRVEAMKGEYDGKIKDLETKYTSAEQELATLKIDRELTTAASKLGLRPEAEADLVARGRGVFRLENGQVVAYVQKDGKLEKAYGADGNPLSIGAYVKDLLKTAPHLFDASKGGGSGGGGGAGTGPNPWAKDSVNITRQMQIMRENPSEAARLKAAAGVA